MRSFHRVLGVSLSLSFLGGGCVRAQHDAALAQPNSAPAVAPTRPSLEVAPMPDAPIDPAVRDACSQEHSTDVLHHTVYLTLGLEPPSLSGRGELRLRVRRPTTVISLDVLDLRVSEFEGDATQLPFHHVDGRVCAELPHPVSAGVELTVRLSWQGTMTGELPHFFRDQVWAGYHASSWMPTLQGPAQRATLSLHIRTDAALEVTASGRKTGTTPLGDQLAEHSFELDHPSPPFLYAFAAGRFDKAEQTVDGFTLRALGPPGSDLMSALATTIPMYRFLVERLAAGLPSDEYVQVFVHGDVAQEAAGMALLSEGALEALRTDPTEDWLFSHELSHQWFAWLVPCVDFSDFWLNEGFATFLVGAFKEHHWNRAAYTREVAIWKQRSARVHEQGRDAPISLSTPELPQRRSPQESELQARGVTYFRGALVLHKLRAELGETTFWSGVQRYVKDRKGKGARTEDLRASFEVTSGRDLRPFFDRWVYSSAPDL
jgi:aminopeptidase N